MTPALLCTAGTRRRQMPVLYILAGGVQKQLGPSLGFLQNFRSLGSDAVPKPLGLNGGRAARP